MAKNKEEKEKVQGIIDRYIPPEENKPAKFRLVDHPNDFYSTFEKGDFREGTVVKFSRKLYKEVERGTLWNASDIEIIASTSQSNSNHTNESSSFRSPAEINRSSALQAAAQLVTILAAGDCKIEDDEKITETTIAMAKYFENFIKGNENGK